MRFFGWPIVWSRALIAGMLGLAALAATSLAQVVQDSTQRLPLRVTQATNPGANSGSRVEGFVYDTTSGGLPRTVKTEADGLNVVREFDAKGQLRFLKDRKGATFEFRYDPLGRRTHVIAPGGAATVTSYTKNGRVASVTEPSGDAAAFSYSSSTGRLQSVAYSGGEF